MTVLGLLIASFITQGQPFLPTFSTTVTIQQSKVQQRLISGRRLSTSISRNSHQPKLSTKNSKYQKQLSNVSYKISWKGSYILIDRIRRKVAFSPVLKTASMNAKPFAFSEKNFKFTPRKEWDIPQTADYDVEQRLLAQYYRGQQLPVLRYGNAGDAVRVLQTLLTYNRYGVGISGKFDVLTETAVKAFQANRRLSADGIVGPRTWQELTKGAYLRTKSRDPMEIPMYGSLPVNPWQRSFRGDFAELTLSI
ncbi:MAG: peptidoglycan-binding domain-containing protein [Cyanobacteria bacterium P01_D01_bin.50]